MQNYKVHGLSEIMIFHCDMDKDEFFQENIVISLMISLQVNHIKHLFSESLIPTMV